MVYWRVLNIDGFIQWRFNWLFIQAYKPCIDNVLQPSPAYKYLTNKA